MGQKASELRKVAIAIATFLSLVGGGCGRSSSVVAPPAIPASAPPALVEQETPAATSIEEARALREQGELDEYERSLRALAASSDDVTRRRAESLLALHLFDQKRYDEAVSALEKAAVDDGLVGPFLRLRIIEAEVGRGNIADATGAAAQVIATAPDTSAATIARLRLPALYAAAGDRSATDAAFEQIARVPIDELTEREFIDLATLLENAGRADHATSIRMRLLREYTQGRYTEKTYGELSAMDGAPLDALSLQTSIELASSLARANRYDQALDLLKRIATRFPQANTNDLYRSVRLRALFNSRHYTTLLEETRGVDLKDPALELMRARAAWRDNRANDFLAGLQRVEKKYPSSREAIEAKVLRAKYYVTDEVDYARSTENLRRAIEAGALGTDGENLWTLGFTYTLWGKDDEALRVFQRYIETYPDGDWKTNSLFWSGKIHGPLGNASSREAAFRQLMAEYPYSYYSYRAREILGEPTVAPHEVPGGAIFPDIEAELAQVGGRRFDAVRELLAIDLSRDASREMKALAAEYPDNSGVAFMLADVYAASGEPFKGNLTLQRRFRQFVRHGGVNVPRRFWEILYPLSYWETIEAEARRRELEPYLVASIIRQESGFEPTVVSSAGAVGLMQIMPQEAARIASAAGIGEMTRERLFDPSENIAVGAAEYAQKLKAMGGDHILAIAAYNAGEEAVGRWIAQRSIGDPDLFVESIPYAETRLYVKSVTRNRFEYRRIYEGSMAATQQNQ